MTTGGGGTGRTGMAREVWHPAGSELAADVSHVSGTLHGHGYRLVHMADVLYAWDLDLGDGSSVQVFSDGHRPADDPDAPVWRVGRYSDEGGWVEVLQPFLLEEAVQVATTLPFPRRDGAPVQGERNTVEDVVAFVSGDEPAPLATVVPVAFGGQSSGR